MSLQDLRELQAALAVVEKAGWVLDKAGLTPCFHLSDRGTVIRCAPLWDGGTAPEVMIEDEDTGAVSAAGPVAGCDHRGEVPPPPVADTGAAQDPGPAAGCDHGADRPEPPAEISDAQHGVFPDGGQDLSASQPGLIEAAVRAVETDSAEAPAPAGAAPESLAPDPGPAAEDQTPAVATLLPAPAVEAPRPGARGDSAGTGVQRQVVTARGELTAAERGAIAEAHARGEEPRAVAARLGRRTQLVAQLYTWLERGVVRVGVEDAPAVPVTLAPVEPVAPADAGSFQPVGAVAARLVAEMPARAGCPDDLHGEERRIWAWLDGLGYARGFSAALDLDIAEALHRGAKPHEVALDLGLDQVRLVDRYKQVSRPIRDDRDRVRVDLLDKLIRVLRLRAAAAQAAA